MTVGFNSPKDPKTVIKATLALGGQDAAHKANELREKYHDSVDAKKEKSRFSGWRAENDDHMFVEIKISTAPGKAKEHADWLGPEILKAAAIIPESEDDFYFKPKVSAHDDSTIAVGLKIHFPNKAPMIQDFANVLNHCGQHIHYTVQLGTSIEDIMKSTQPVVKSVAEGFNVQAKTCIISNMKKVLMELAKDEKYGDKIGMMMMAAPATMLTVNGNLEFGFDDIEEVENHPLAGPLMMTFEQGFEGALGSNHNEMLETKLDTDGIPQPEPQS